MSTFIHLSLLVNVYSLILQAIEEREDKMFAEKQTRWNEGKMLGLINHRTHVTRVKIDDVVVDHSGINCICCDDPVEAVKATYCRILWNTSYNKLMGIRHYLDVNNGVLQVTTEKPLIFSEKRKGFVCPSCLGKLANRWVKIGNNEELVLTPIEQGGSRDTTNNGDERKFSKSNLRVPYKRYEHSNARKV